MDDFSKRIVVITGATRGIGKAIACSFLDHGATVLGTYLTNSDHAQSFLQEREKLPGSLHLRQCDVRSDESVKQFVDWIEREFGRLDILVNNAGIRKDVLLPLMSEEQWRAVLDTNLTGTFLMCRYAVPLMMSNRFGRIINITSPSGQLGFQGQTNYSASKAGQVGFSRSLAKEVARKKITVNCISPGFIDTDLLEDLDDQHRSGYKKMVPMRRFGTPEEVAHAVLFLASTRASYITGSTLEITGGL